MTADTTSVLIVEDEPELAELYATWLEDRFRVETAHDGTEAIEAIDETFDVVLLDRRIPGQSGVDVLDAIRDRGLESRVAMVTAVEPDFDIVDIGFDDYLLKPVSRDELRDGIDRLLLRRAYDEQLQEFFTLASKKAMLVSRKSEAELQSSQEYAELEDRLAVLRVQVDETRTELLEQTSYRQLYQDIERIPTRPDEGPN
ncbi:DNA-binding protein [Natronococcus pandeyae]|uniref:DNA-binding protein n=1 Tax=Natronococcus pandeyae TaxID=2055836 RepID=A0A8J8Q0H4_9EURY|nr:response regulator [Natronococcus pandeyae]TYL37052.1 DNA-binding protein [Natronococcus pandeyae]